MLLFTPLPVPGYAPAPSAALQPAQFARSTPHPPPNSGGERVPGPAMPAARTRPAPDGEADVTGDIKTPALGAVDEELTAPVTLLTEKWKLLPAFLKVRTGPGHARGWRRAWAGAASGPPQAPCDAAGACGGGAWRRTHAPSTPIDASPQFALPAPVYTTLHPLCSRAAW